MGTFHGNGFSELIFNVPENISLLRPTFVHLKCVLIVKLKMV